MRDSILMAIFVNLHHVRAQNDVILANQQKIMAKSEDMDIDALMKHQNELIFRLSKEKGEVELDALEKHHFGENSSDGGLSAT